MTANYAIGLMSGTSLDGVDASLIRVRTRRSEWSVDLLGHHYRAFPKNWKSVARDLERGNKLKEAFLYGAVWSEFAAGAVKQLLRKTKRSPAGIDVIGAHGQTVFHAPVPRPFLSHHVNTTIQLVDPSRLAIRCGIPVVSGFRTADLAVGGQGAPFAPHAHALLFGKRGKTIAVQNFGGIGNVTLLRNHHVALAFDTGPGNIWIDSVASMKSRGRHHFDPEGRFARNGQVDFQLVEKLLRHPFLSRKPPKSADWKEFGPDFLRRHSKKISKLTLNDACATMTFATAAVTAQSYRRFLPKGLHPISIVVCGGGARNLMLIHWLSKLIPDASVCVSDGLGIPHSAVESIAFALFALETLKGVPSNEPKATGARHPVICGSTTYPTPFRQIDRVRALLYR